MFEANDISWLRIPPFHELGAARLSKELDVVRSELDVRKC